MAENTRKNHRNQQSSTSTFKFVTLSHPDDIRSHKNVQTEIRRHVMKDIGKRRRRPKSTSQSDQGSPMTPVDVGGSLTRSLPPLGSFPVPADTRMLELVRFAKEANTVYFPFRDVWFDLSLSDPGAFYVTLGNSAVLWKSISQKDSIPNHEPQRLFSQSLVHLGKRLNNPEENTSPGTIANILAHICLNLRNADWGSWRVHMNGLDLMWKTRGGFLDLADHMPTLIMLYDLAGAMVFDSVPRFPLPADLSRALSAPSTPSRQLQNIIHSLSQSSYTKAARDVLVLLSSVADTVNMRGHSPSFWKRDIDGINLLGPCIHVALSVPRMSTASIKESPQSDLVVLEMVRLTGLTLMSTLKEHFSFFATERPYLQEKLVNFVATYSQYVSEEHNELVRWVLITASLLQRNEQDIRIHQLLRQLCESAKLSIAEMVEWAKDVLWINAIEAPNEERLIHDVDS